jgi:hypothetical protein
MHRQGLKILKFSHKNQWRWEKLKNTNVRLCRKLTLRKCSPFSTSYPYNMLTIALYAPMFIMTESIWIRTWDISWGIDSRNFFFELSLIISENSVVLNFLKKNFFIVLIIFSKIPQNSHIKIKLSIENSLKITYYWLNLVMVTIDQFFPKKI